MPSNHENMKYTMPTKYENMKYTAPTNYENMKFTSPKYEIHFSVEPSKYTFTHQLKICSKYISVNDRNIGVLVGYQTRPQALVECLAK